MVNGRKESKATQYETVYNSAIREAITEVPYQHLKMLNKQHR